MAMRRVSMFRFCLTGFIIMPKSVITSTTASAGGSTSPAVPLSAPAKTST